MSGPLASILIPCHNAAPWLAETLESALAQTWPDCEVILVDDGSTDGSATIARRYEPRGVRVLEQDNRGASAARNRAYRECRGDFIQFLDADDLISPDKIARQVEALLNRPPGTVASCAWGRFTDRPDRATFRDQSVERDFTPLDFLTFCSEGDYMMHPSAWLTPRKVADRAGPWNEELTRNDDGEYFCRVLLAGAGIAFVPGPRSFYRSGLPRSLSQRRDEPSRRSEYHAAELIANHLLKTEDTARVHRAIANYFQRFIHDHYPHPAELMRAAAAQVAAHGGSTRRPPMGPKTAALAQLVGWKVVWRLKHLLRR